MNVFKNKPKEFHYERNDCSVIALANAFEIDYSLAHKICSKAGRKDKKGFSLNRIWKLSGAFRQSRTFLGRRVGYHPRRPKMSVKKFVDKHPEGNYIICVSNHYCALINGELLNQSKDSQRVKYYFYISKITSNANQSEYKEVGNSQDICEITEYEQAAGQSVDSRKEISNEIHQGMAATTNS